MQRRKNGITFQTWYLNRRFLSIFRFFRTTQFTLLLPLFFLLCSSVLHAQGSGLPDERGLRGEIDRVVTALENYAAQNNTYTVTGGGWRGKGNGWFHYKANSIWPESISNVLLNGGYLNNPVPIDPLLTQPGTSYNYDFWVNRCKDRVAVFAKSSIISPSSQDQTWWSTNNCTQIPISTHGLGYYKVSLPLSTVYSSQQQLLARASLVDEVVAGLESYAGINGTYKVTGGGWSGNGQGWFHYENGGVWPKSIANVLLEQGHFIGAAPVDPLHTNPGSLSPYDYHVHRCKDRVGVFANLYLQPTATDQSWWQQNNCPLNAKTQHGLNYFVVSLPVAATTPTASIAVLADASRFMQIASLSADDQSALTIATLGKNNWLENQLSTVEPQSRYNWMLGLPNATTDPLLSFKYFNRAQWRRLFTAQSGVRERWVLALSEIFVVNTKGITAAGSFGGFGAAAYLDLLESHGLGNFRDLIEEITLSPQMGAFLSMLGSRKGNGQGRAPDENYAREILQLFSIGLYELNLNGTIVVDGAGKPIETYTNTDIEALSKVFTGWDRGVTFVQSLSGPSHHLQQMTKKPHHHDHSTVNFMGTTIPGNLNQSQRLNMALDVIFNHPNVGPFLSEQFIKRMVTSNPSPQYIARVASVFNQDANGVRGNLRAVLKAVLLDPEATVETPNNSFKGKLREPMLRFVQWGRTFGLNDGSGNWDIPNLSSAGYQLGQSTLYAPSVFNFFRPGYVPPGTQLSVLGLTAPELQITNETTVAGYSNYMQKVIEHGLNGSIQPDYSAELSLANQPSQLVDRLNMLLTANQMESATYNSIVSAVSSMPGGSANALRKRVYAAIFLTMISPDYLVLR